MIDFLDGSPKRRGIVKSPLKHKLVAFVILLSAAVSQGAEYDRYMVGQVLTEHIFRHPEKVHRNVEVADDGAIGANIPWERGQSPKWFIEEQRDGADMIQAGIAVHDDGLIEKGVQVINWGIAREAQDGSFPGTKDAEHSVSFFVEAVSRAALLLRECRPELYKDKAQPWLDPLHRAATWLAHASLNEASREKNLYPFGHRYYLCGTGLAQAALLLNDEKLAAAAFPYIEDGIKCQWPDGTNPEKGGFDAGYHAFGLALACRFYFVCEDPGLKARVKEMLVKGLAKELALMDESGDINLGTSTRVGKEMDRSGHVKTMNYRALIQALAGAHSITGDPKYLEAARSIGAHWQVQPLNAAAH